VSQARCLTPEEPCPSPSKLGLPPKTPVQALELAVEAENSAILYYALATTSTGEAAAFFEGMGKDEEGHAATIRALLTLANPARGVLGQRGISPPGPFGEYTVGQARD
jgi:hypothetical protein